jgi:hypothetical protein
MSSWNAPDLGQRALSQKSNLLPALSDEQDQPLKDEVNKAQEHAHHDRDGADDQGQVCPFLTRGPDDLLELRFCLSIPADQAVLFGRAYDLGLFARRLGRFLLTAFGK